MLYATVNTTSVTVTVCICHEMRQKQKEFALVNRMRERKDDFSCWLLTVLRAFVPASTQMSPNVSHRIYCKTVQIYMKASCIWHTVLCSPEFLVTSQAHFFLSVLLTFNSFFCDVQIWGANQDGEVWTDQEALSQSLCVLSATAFWKRQLRYVVVSLNV